MSRIGVVAVCVLMGLGVPAVAVADPVPLEPVSCAGRTDVVRVKSSAGDGRPVCFEIPDDFGEYAVDVPGAYLLAGDNAHPITVTLIDGSGTAGAVDIDLGGWTAVGAGKEHTAASALRLISAATAQGYAAITAERKRLSVEDPAEGFVDFFLSEPLGHVRRAQPHAAETPENLGWVQYYEGGGAIYYTAAGGARAIYGMALDSYLKTGGPAGPLGYPSTSQQSNPGGAKNGWHVDFAGNPAAAGGGNGGTIYWNALLAQTFGAQVLYGPVWEKWVALGRAAWQGEPLTSLTPTPSGPNGAGAYAHFGQPTQANQQDLEGLANASIFYSDQTKQAHTVQGLIRQTWRQNGWEQGRFGFPTTDTTASPTGGVLFNHFTHGSIYWKPGVGIRVVTDQIHTKYASLNYESGPLGNPVTDATTFGSNGGRVQRFDGGSIYSTPTGGTTAVYGDIARKYAEFGNETGILGYPVSDTTTAGDGKGQFVTFSNGAAIYWSPTTGAHAVYGTIRAKWNELGAEKSFLGYPTSDETALPKGRRNTFTGGRIDWSSEGGATVAYTTQALTAKAVEFKGTQSGRCIQIAGVGNDALADLAGAELWDCYTTAVKQIWDVVDLGGNKYAFKNRNSGKCLDLYNANTTNGTTIDQYTCHYGAAQQWEITTAPNGSIALRSATSGKVVEAFNNQTGNATRVQQWMDLIQANQQWTIVPV
ncbi:RICIN domain-containing protein [Amycolatopsis sp. PS_44_ISF1]|uniref:RICIN domain-containing protein n=1 Tax=Amycolatopsis sp. PS_44_ISF1 TaxID=2974917 RepID=UPI0028DEA5C3|nr:RICIN domain-containing protein [Amycolatopsis sp. PS_44_ISF1]MDT8912090.1 RICIN domain-containing protein [Amycolatopsis sp. PS_44_ISF1]